MTQQKQIIQEIDKFVTKMMNVKEEEKKKWKLFWILFLKK